MMPLHARLDKYISTGDNIWMVDWLPMDSPAAIKESFQLLRDGLHVQRIYWRGMQYQTYERVLTIRPHGYPRLLDHFDQVLALTRSGIDTTAVKTARSLGMEIWGLSTLYDWGAPPETTSSAKWPFYLQAEFLITNPEWMPLDKYGVRRQGGPADFSYPEARETVSILVRDCALETGYDGVLFITYVENYSMRFNDEYGFNEPALKEFKKRYGIDAREISFEQGTYNPNASKFTWRQFRGEYVTKFFQELREKLPEKMQIGIMINPQEPDKGMKWPMIKEYLLTGSGNFQIDLPRWCREKTVDHFLVYGATSSREKQTDIVQYLLQLSGGKIKTSPWTSGPDDVVWQPLIEQGIYPVYWHTTEEHILQHIVKKPESASLNTTDTLSLMWALSQTVLGKQQASFDELTPYAEHKSILVRRLALKALTKIKDKRAISILENALNDREHSVRGVAVSCLKELHGSDSTKHILAMFQNGKGSHSTRETAVYALAAIKPPVSMLTSMYSAKAPYELKALILMSLKYAEENPTVVMPVFQAALAEKEIRINNYALETIGSRSSLERMTLLISVLNSTNVQLACYAAQLLGNLYKSNPSVFLNVQKAIIERIQKLFLDSSEPAHAHYGWGYRPLGNALIDFEGAESAFLHSTLTNTKKLQTARYAWEVLYIPQRPAQMIEVSEKENDAVFAHFPHPFISEILSCNFDQEEIFYKNPGTNKIAGTWSGFSADGPVLSTEASHSGKQSVKMLRPPATPQFLTCILAHELRTDNTFTISWMMKRNAQTGIIVNLMNEGGFNTAPFSLYIQPAKTLLKSDKTGWTDQGIKFPVDSWFQVKLRIQGNIMSLITEDLKKSNVSAVTSKTDGKINRISFITQPPDGGAVYIDDVHIQRE